MKRREVKRKAQEILMDTISTAYYRLEEIDEHTTEEEKSELQKELKKQADRVAKMLGYEQSWTS
ncbi:hypothetical protein [Paenibacillus thiaminolyticus]|uniref:hypothetical protein n=1 Tax=Paenibacillus thiaminolyticus TaxID=49283 RepID=UPI002543844C|nr:hypothetical protein [Paenibacillus thiaminolyticus]WII39216.1 hypothetical protein O0V01_09050 [Paenibacillus thiaminolyticus]